MLWCTDVVRVVVFGGGGEVGSGSGRLPGRSVGRQEGQVKLNDPTSPALARFLRFLL